MNILPYRKLTYNSPLSENEIRNRLNCLTRAANAFRVKYYPNIKTSDYEGDIYEHAFFVTRLISYRNSFLPAISGKMTPHAAGTTVSVTMKLNIVAIVFGCIWFGGLFLFLITAMLSGHFFIGSLGLPLLMMLFGAILFAVPFAIEASIAQKDLARIFECQPELK
jgi:hypothetical protein